MNLLTFLYGRTSTAYDKGRTTALVMLVAFLLTFICVRTYTRIARIRGLRSAYIAGVHTHHLVFGVVIAFFAGGLEFALLPDNGPVRLLLAALFGGGAAMVLDEFALAVHLQDVYWEKEGRKSVDAVIFGAIFGLLFVLHTAPFGHPNDLSRLALTLIELLNMVGVLIAALKGKLFLAVFGVFIPVLALLGAIRLAEPGSLWSRQFYASRPGKTRAAEARYAAYGKVWQPRKDRLWDIVGGKTGRPLHPRKQSK
ncbi:MAG TPA: hypothetical protein VLF69_02310 [Candidatus Saccharimonadales bacterium]|nr:hypothetical protein [Candidatus Saccharimonadales bacterium]